MIEKSTSTFKGTLRLENPRLGYHEGEPWIMIYPENPPQDLEELFLNVGTNVGSMFGKHALYCGIVKQFIEMFFVASSIAFDSEVPIKSERCEVTFLSYPHNLGHLSTKFNEKLIEKVVSFCSSGPSMLEHCEDEKHVKYLTLCLSELCYNHIKEFLENERFVRAYYLHLKEKHIIPGIFDENIFYPLSQKIISYLESYVIQFKSVLSSEEKENSNEKIAFSKLWLVGEEEFNNLLNRFIYENPEFGISAENGKYYYDSQQSGTNIKMAGFLVALSTGKWINLFRKPSGRPVYNAKNLVRMVNDFFNCKLAEKGDQFQKSKLENLKDEFYLFPKHVKPILKIIGQNKI